mmetsp:Transcript_62388/g.103770  ORF Transcript_62388/g.103770 Transcript_62388/m.103770 type:complete len:258 (+) Transcript_62388:81-854(+)
MLSLAIGPVGESPACVANSTFTLSGRWPGSRGMATHHTDRDVAQEMARQIGDATLMDIGAGAGHYGAYFHELRGKLGQGAVPRWTGVDGSANVEQYTRSFGPPGSHTAHHDICDPASALPVYDWVMSFDVGEHLPRSCLGVYLSKLHQTNRKGIWLVWAEPGIPGHCHISRRTQTYVVAAVERLGYTFSRQASAKARLVSRNTWHQRGLLVLERGGGCATNYSRTRALAEATACIRTPRPVHGACQFPCRRQRIQVA